MVKAIRPKERAAVVQGGILRYWGYALLVFLFCLFLQAGKTFGAEKIPLEALSIPVKDRPYLPPRNQVASMSYTSNYSAKSYRPVRNSSSDPVMLSPMVGTTIYSSYWNNRVQNGLTSGLALDIPLTEMFSGELEGGFGTFSVAYRASTKDFNQYWVGGGPKVYFTRDYVFRPFLGLGIEATQYENLRSGWVGVVNTSLGTDIHFSEQFALAVRGGWYHPSFNRAPAEDLAVTSTANMDAVTVNDDFFRVMGAVKVGL